MNNKSISQPLELRSNNRRGARRPDMCIYVPRALRQKASESLPDLEQKNLDSSLNSLSVSASEKSSSDSAEGSDVANQEPRLDSTDQSLGDEEFVQVSGSGPTLWPPAWDQTVSYFMNMTLDDQADENCGENAIVTPTEATVQQQHDDEHLYSEIKANLKPVDIIIKNTCSDFFGYANIWLNQEEFTHVIEIYDFPAMFKTNDLLDAFSDYSEGGMKIKWVDNTHALGIFSSQTAAAQALSLKHPLLKTRTLSEGSQKAKWKAIRRSEFIQPVKERPRTDTVVARRMVTRALGLRGESRGKRF